MQPKFPYYLIIRHYSLDIIRTITSLDHCRSLDEIFDKDIVQSHPLRRIKYYHLPCQNRSLNLSCFYDDIYMCICEDDRDQRLVYCFEFDHQTKLNDSDVDSNKAARECRLKYPLNSTMSSTSSALSTRTGILATHACKHFIYLIILFLCLHIHYGH